ncbi:MAG: AAA family ATPase [Candidatus Polarisedimenticolia bacterium]
MDGRTSTLPVERAMEVARALEGEVSKAIVGQREVVSQVIAAFLAAGHVLLEGVPGLGKTLAILALARAFGGKFARIQFTPDLMPSDIVGHTLLDAATGQFRVRFGPAFTNLLLADEVNRAPAKTQSALLEVMQEHQITIEGQTFPLSRPFMTLATQNPVELEGTYPLPEAQLDRFLLKVRISYPEELEEIALVSGVTQGRVGDALDVSMVGMVADVETVAGLQEVVAGLTVDERVAGYAVRIVRATRTWQGIFLGAGPRGGIALLRVARAFALMQSRDFVTPDDVKRAALPALRHRVVLAPDLEMEGQEVDEVISRIVETVEVPRR